MYKATCGFAFLETHAIIMKVFPGQIASSSGSVLLLYGYPLGKATASSWGFPVGSISYTFFINSLIFEFYRKKGHWCPLDLARVLTPKRACK